MGSRSSFRNAFGRTVVLLFKDFIPFGKISNYSEKFIEIILISLGMLIFYKIFIEDKKHKYLHIHSNGNLLIHKHQYIHTTKKFHNHKHLKLKQEIISATSVGFIHGLARIVHFLLFIPEIGFSSKLNSTKYIIDFGIGTLIATTSFTFVIGGISTFSKQNYNNTFFKELRLTGGLFALLIGVYRTISH